MSSNVLDAEFPTEMLEDLFQKFTEASGKLERRYEALLLETQELRVKLREKDREIERAERLSVLGETAAAIAHEIRNPLGSIKLFVSLLRDEVEDNEQAMEYLATVNQSMQRLDGVISNILHFSREQAPQMGPVNLNALIQEQITSLAQCGYTGTKSCLFLEGNPFVLGNEDGLRQVFANLLTNAAQANGTDGGAITVRTEDAEDHLLITIDDSGSGIPEHVMPTLFDPFVSTKAEGTGLGLAIVRRIVAQHGGTISAENMPQGARFKISLPRKPQ